MIKTYSELIKIPSYIERYHYLKLSGKVGDETFGRERFLNQVLYSSVKWKQFRRDIIIRDDGLDLACDGYNISGKILIHHLNPITIDEVVNNAPSLFDPENVVCASLGTHNAIHYGDESLLFVELVERKPNDTCPWRR